MVDQGRCFWKCEEDKESRSIRHEWAGESDLENGKLEASYQEYIEQQKMFAQWPRNTVTATKLESDLKLVVSGLDINLRMLEDDWGWRQAGKWKTCNQRGNQMQQNRPSLNMNKELKSSTTSLRSQISANIRCSSMTDNLLNSYFSMSIHCTPRRGRHPHTLWCSW